MRSCPHCNKEIQDEAVFCRFCRRDIDPPLWLTSLQKCRFCAEWVERGIERCPLCGRELLAEQPFSVDIEGSEHSESLLGRLKPSLEKKPESAGDAHPEVEDVSEVAYSKSPREKVKTPYRPAESEEGLAILHDRRLDSDRDFDPLAGLLPSPDKEIPEDDQEQRSFSRPTIIRWVLISAGIIAAAAILIVVIRSLDLSSLFAQRERTPVSTGAPSIAPTTAAAMATERPEGSPSPEPTITPEPEESGCMRWDKISLDSEGETLCVYGVIKRWFQVGEIPYVAIFSEEMGTFEIIDYTRTYPEFKSGTCVMVEGEIEIMRNVRPFIDANGILGICEPGLVPTATE
ncbi:MAG: hypothetical protein WBB65_03210 [Anaerolineales bacterium]